MHTEEQAKELWCPHVRHGDTDEVALNSFVDGERDQCWAKCIGPKCSQWRWFHKSESFYTQKGEQVGAKGTGYCGLAGKP